MWIALQFANENTFFFGSAVFVAIAVWSLFRKQNAFSRVACLVGIVFVSASSTPLPRIFYALWAVGLGAFMFANGFSNARFRSLAASVLIVLTLIAAGMELPHLFEPGIVIDRHDTIFVIGDSITAGVSDRERDKMWPELLRKERRLNIVDLSQPGATLASALRGQQSVIQSDQPDRSALILEIGGNDLLGEVGVARFRSDLGKLLKAVRPKAQSIVMFELPLLPFHNGYGIAQRDLAKQFHVSLIPKRCFTKVLGAGDATIDGLHLSPSGQVLMAELVSKTISSDSSADQRPAKNR